MQRVVASLRVRNVRVCLRLCAGARCAVDVRTGAPGAVLCELGGAWKRDVGELAGCRGVEEAPLLVDGEFGVVEEEGCMWWKRDWRGHLDKQRMGMVGVVVSPKCRLRLM